ncbi:DEAD/DEAH box helicase [Pseudaminobacter arsenicus]|uniref:DEAD/DEAH box helicase n=1 Tax=Borborobacter arsenicus TaxID=1851146 RepID=A0A432V1G2_9HYPH|nr:DEAD/DEAH box helicase [Pseudaminobacter arsenicus]RUM95945.1 DEAD/DEAH box helicase [Pseudaminobacter arsenicus]
MTDLGTMAPALAAALASRGYEALTPVQQAMLTPEAHNADLLVSAQTGSGKTVAFGIAIAPTLLGGAERFEPAGLPLALIVAPTRELAIQVRREFEWLYRETGARIASCVGGMDMRGERRALADGAHIVVGTPGRLRDHITRGSLDITELRAIVLDEADEMLDLGFRDDLEFILAAAPAERRTLLFSATVPNQIAQLAKRFQRDAHRIIAQGESSQHTDIEYQQILVAPADRENAIINTLLFFDSQNSIVFCHTREAVKHLSSRLANRGFAVVSLSGELSQAERTNALQSMRDGRARICVATDVAARGIDLPNLDLVIHADLPSNPDTLLHRSGRTGRAGRKGICTLIVPFHRRGAANRVLKLAKLSAQTVPAPTASDIERHNRQRILDDPALSVLPDEDEIGFVRELMATHGAEQIAAAYLRLQLAARPAPEELMEAPAHFAERERRPQAERAPRSDFDNGVWFRVSVGRKQRAEPRWLLPMICKAGGITKRAVGSIRIQDTDSQFEIAGDKADAFWASVKQNGTGEKGVTIQRMDGAPPAPEPAFSPKTSRKTGKFKPKPDGFSGKTDGKQKKPRKKKVKKQS